MGPIANRSFEIFGGNDENSNLSYSTSPWEPTVQTIAMAAEKSIQSLDLFLCGFVDFPKSGEDCSQRVPNICVQCEIHGAYLNGETIDEFGFGHMFCRVTWYFCLVVAFVGVFANFLIILVIRRRKSEKSFDFLICTLAKVDLLCCLTTFSSASAPIAYFENWHGRGKGSLYWMQVSSLTLLFLRSINIFLTLLITLERYLVIVYPLRSITWFTKPKTKIQAFLCIFISLLISIPRFSSLYIGPNIYGSQEGGLDVPSLRHLKYIYLPTRLYNFWQLTFHGAHNQIEYWIPIPLLLLFNYLSYKRVKSLGKKRQQLNCSQRQELQAARMFLPVVVLLLCFNLWPTIAFVVMQFWGIYHREMWMTWSLTIALNSSVNFWIYYYRGNNFKSEVRLLVSLNLPETINLKFDSHMSNRSSINFRNTGDSVRQQVNSLVSGTACESTIASSSTDAISPCLSKKDGGRDSREPQQSQIK